MQQKYEIRRATKSDISMIMEYIDEDWKKGHIMSSNRALFEYEFLESDGTVNMVIALNLITNRIDGCLGFIKSSRNTETFDSWGTIWKVREGCDNLLGLRLISEVWKIPGNQNYLNIGLNPYTAGRIHKMLLKEFVDKMRHYYILADRKEYKIALVEHKETDYIAEISCPYSVYKLNREDFITYFTSNLAEKGRIPHKNREYFIHRYYDHVIYDYDVYGIMSGDNLHSFFVVREDSYEEHIALRMVDYFGDENAMVAIGQFLPQLFLNELVEYIDFYEYGYSDYNIKKAGFQLLEENDTNIIPNYFHPFVQKNIDIWISSPVEGTKFVKGDGDQDRPN